MARPADAGIVVSVFIDADSRAVDAAHRIGGACAGFIPGRAPTRSMKKGRDAESPQVVQGVEGNPAGRQAVRALGMRFNTGHALNYA